MEKIIAGVLLILITATHTYAQNVNEDDEFSPEVQEATCVIRHIQLALGGGTEQVFTGKTLDQAVKVTEEALQNLGKYQHYGNYVDGLTTGGLVIGVGGIAMMVSYFGRGGIHDVVKDVLSLYAKIAKKDLGVLTPAVVQLESAQLQEWLLNPTNRSSFQTGLKSLQAELHQQFQNEENHMRIQISAMNREQSVAEVIDGLDRENYYQNIGKWFANSHFWDRTGEIMVIGGAVLTAAVYFIYGKDQSVSMTTQNILDMDLHDIQTYFEAGKDDLLLQKIRSFAPQIAGCH